MAKKKTISSELKSIKVAQDQGKLIIGTSQVMRALVRGAGLSQVFTSSNCPQSVKEDLSVYCKLSGVELRELSYPNDEIGPLVKKQYSVAVLAIQ